MATVEIGKTYREAREEVIRAMYPPAQVADHRETPAILLPSESERTRCYLGDHPRGSDSIQVLIIKHKGQPNEVRTSTRVCRECFGWDDSNLLFVQGLEPILCGES